MKISRPPSTAIILIASYLFFGSRFVLPSKLKTILTCFLLLHWRRLPTLWHFIIFSPIGTAIHQRIRAKYGLYAGNGRSKELGFPQKDAYIRSIGFSPFSEEVVSIIQKYVGFSESDYNVHLSNSVYATDLDNARVQLICDIALPTTRVPGFVALLGGTSYIFLKEIPSFNRYQIETKIVAYNDRWYFELHRFTLPKSHARPRDIVVKTKTGERVVCTYALSKITCKIGRNQVKPVRISSYCGFGPDGDNWSRAKSLQKQGMKAVLKWLHEEDTPHGLEMYDEQNKAALAIIDRLGGGENKAIWLELDQVHSSYNAKQQ